MKLFANLIPLITVFLFFSFSSQGQIETPDTLKTATGNIYGTLLTPVLKEKVPLVLIIAGSGPTDRDGNNRMMVNNCLKILADSLVAHHIASLRYDKRGIAASQAAGSKEADLRFENYIDDAALWVEKLKKDPRFSKVFIVGHSEGSLIGMIAAKKAGADAFISISGVGTTADITIKEQVAKQSPSSSAIVNSKLDSLKNGYTLKNVDPSLNVLFRPSIQPYMISWLKYDPQKEIAKLSIPILIIQGNHDLQVDTTDALLLSKASKNSTLRIIEGMNHIMKDSPKDMMRNIGTYSAPDLPVKKEIVSDIVAFVVKNK